MTASYSNEVSKRSFKILVVLYELKASPEYKTPIKTSITLKIHPKNYPQSLLVDITSRLIRFEGVFIVGKGRYGRICDFHSILLPKK